MGTPQRRVASRWVDEIDRMDARRKRLLIAGFDSAAWAIGLTVGEFIRYNDFSFGIPRPAGLVTTAIVAVTAQLSLGTWRGLYRGRYRTLSFEGAGAVVSACFAVAAGLLVLNLFDHRFVPESVPIIGGVAALIVMLGGRYVARLLSELRRRPVGNDCARVLVFGAGQVAEDVIGSMLRNPASPYLPVALLDDDPSKRHLSIMGVPVAGSRHDMERASRAYGADTLLIAIRSGSGALHRALSQLASDAGLVVKVVPSMRELLEGSTHRLDFRQLTLEDLVGRREIRTDLAAAARYLTGRRVLVTGAGGSIGSEIARQVHRFHPAELIMLDRDETALHALQLSIEGHGLLDSPNLVLLDIRDREGVDALFAERRPEVVFHAAALKHLPMLEVRPGEAVQTNVWGTLHLLEAAARHGVERFVNISTDKAVEPSSVLGYSKRICERLTAAVGASSAIGTYLSVRFGNVLGSRGSVLHTFSAQILAKGPVTVTDPEVRRYFMSIEEAVQLVIQAGAVGASGEALVLDMGEPVLISQVAQRMIAESKEEIGVVFTGLRPGEKLNEALFNVGEIDERRHHPLISHVVVPPLHPGRVLLLDPATPSEVLVSELRRLCSSSGFRANEKPAELDVGSLDLNPGVSDRMLRRLFRSRPFSEKRTLGSPSARRCERHRRWIDRDVADQCIECVAADVAAMAPPRSGRQASRVVAS